MKHPTTLLLLLVLGLSPAAAEVKNVGDPRMGNSADLIADAKNSWIEPRQIRCWQEGRLIVEENNWVPGDIQRPVAFLRNKNDVLYMFDFNKTFCLYRKSEVQK